jgi:gliding motility-associated-like protein
MYIFMIIRILFSSIFFISTFASFAQCSDCTSCIIINEFATDPNAINVNGVPDNTGEFIELFNKCDKSVDIGCYVICLTDNDGNRGDCITISSGTSISAGGVFVLGGFGTNCSGGTASCDWPGLTLNLNWHSSASSVWNVNTNSFYTTNVGNFIGVLTDGGEEISFFDCTGSFIEGFTYEGGSGTYTTTENIGAVSGCPAKSVTINTNNITNLGDNPTGGDDDSGWKRNCDNTWSFAQASAATSFVQLNPGTSQGCTLITTGNASFTASTIEGIEPLSVNFTNTSTPSTVTYEWDFETDGTIDSNDENPSFTFNAEGTYTVTLYITDEFGCTDEFEIQIKVNPVTSEPTESSLEMPNVFTPNNDGQNDYFKPISINMIEERLQIFNRWGQLLFEGNEVGVKWDGTFNGADVHEGTYFYNYYGLGADDVVYENKNRKDNSCPKCKGQVLIIRNNQN